MLSGVRIRLVGNWLGHSLKYRILEEEGQFNRGNDDFTFLVQTKRGLSVICVECGSICRNMWVYDSDERCHRMYCVTFGEIALVEV